MHVACCYFSKGPGVRYLTADSISPKLQDMSYSLNFLKAVSIGFRAEGFGFRA